MANIHYFQRYHGQENVHTANAFLLLNRLYQYKSEYFYMFLDSIVEDEQLEYNFRLNMKLQVKSEKNKKSTIPDAMILQHGYRLCVETKIGDWFYDKQIEGHLKTFENLDTKYKIFITLSNSDECKIAPKIEEFVNNFNEEHELYGEDRLIYKHLTFEKLVEIIESILSDRDYDFADILEDYRDYCMEQNLIDDRYQRMRACLAGTTLEANKKLNLYYSKASNIFRDFDILGLYKNKKIVAIGKVVKKVKATMPKKTLKIADGQDVTEDEKNRIIEAILDADRYGYNLRDIEHVFYLVDDFIECDFEKVSKRGLLGGKIFRLETDYGIADIKTKSIEEIAKELSGKTWM